MPKATNKPTNIRRKHTRGTIGWTEELFDQAKTTKRQTDDKITNQKTSWEEEQKVAEQRVEGWREAVGRRSSCLVVV